MIPIEMITMLGSTVLGGVMKLWSRNLENKRATHEMMMARAGLEQEAYTAARTYENPGFQWTRRVIALAVITAVVVLPKIVALINPEIPIYVGYVEEIKKGFWFFSYSTDVTLWEPLKGLVITPLDTHLCSAITGLYFGGSLVK